MKVAIVGAGKLGTKVTKTLLDGDHAVTLIDMDKDILQKVGSHMDVMTVNANAKETKVLKNIGISSFDFLVQRPAATKRTSSSRPLRKNSDASAYWPE